MKTYDKIAKDYDKEFCQNIYYRDDLNFFLEKLPKNADILDVGCGSGHIASYLEKRGFVVTGIDFSQNMIQLAKKRCRKVKFIKIDKEFKIIKFKEKLLQTEHEKQTEFFIVAKKLSIFSTRH